MAETVEGSILQALFARVSSLVLSPALPVAWPNVTFVPPANQKFLRVQFVPNINNRVLIDSDGPHQRLGLLQISVQWPKGLGEAQPRELAGKVAEHFPTDLRLTADGLQVRVTKAADVADLIVEDARIQIPVMVAWECWA